MDERRDKTKRGLFENFDRKCKTLIENARLRGKTNSQVKVGVSYTKSLMRFYKKKKRDQRKGDWYRRKTAAPIDKKTKRQKDKERFLAWRSRK